MNLLSFPVALILVPTCFYLWFVARIIVGLRRLEPIREAQHLPKLTVIVPARNEEATIPECLRSLLGQDYPSENLEIIVVDDASDDATAREVKAVQARDPRVRLLTLPSNPGLRIGRKPVAVATAVEEASGDIVLTTDADCTHHPRWLRTMVAAFSPSTALVAGPVALRARPSFFGQLEHLDFFGWVTASAGLIGAGRPIICNGANLAYRRDAYRAAQSDVQVSSSDDGTLLSRIVTRRLGAVGYASHPDAVVTAGAADSLAAFFRQRRRWAAVRGRFLDPTIYVELVMLFCFFCSLLTIAILSIMDAAWLPLLLFVVAAKSLIDGAAISIAGRRWKIPWSIGPFLVTELLQPIAIVAASVISLRVPFVWKGRRLQR